MCILYICIPGSSNSYLTQCEIILECASRVFSEEAVANNVVNQWSTVRPSLTCHRHRVELGRCQYVLRATRQNPSSPSLFPSNGHNISRWPTTANTFEPDRTRDSTYFIVGMRINTSGWILTEFFFRQRLLFCKNFYSLVNVTQLVDLSFLR